MKKLFLVVLTFLVCVVLGAGGCGPQSPPPPCDH